MDPLIVVALINTIGLIVVAWMANRTRIDIGTVKHEMNSMRDDLVAGAHREGVTQGKAERSPPQS